MSSHALAASIAIATLAASTLIAASSHADLISRLAPSNDLEIKPEVNIITQDLIVETWEVPKGTTVYIADGVSIQASSWIHVAGTIETVGGDHELAPSPEPSSGATVSLSCSGPIYVSGLIRTSDGSAGTTELPSGGDGGSVALECPILVIDGRIQTGSGGPGSDGGDGGNGGDLYITCFENSSTDASRLNYQLDRDAPDELWHIISGDGGGAGAGNQVVAAKSISAGRGGNLHFSDPSPSLAEAWGIQSRDSVGMTAVLIESGLNGPWLGQMDVTDEEYGAAFAADGPHMLALTLLSHDDSCKRGLEGRNGQRAILGTGAQGANGDRGTPLSPDGKTGGMGHDGGQAFGFFERFDGKDGKNATDCCGEEPTDGKHGGHGGDAGYMYGGKGGTGGIGGNAHKDPMTLEWLGVGGNGGPGGTGGSGAGGDGGSSGDGGDGFPNAGPPGIEKLGATGVGGGAGDGGPGGMGLVPGQLGPLGGTGAQSWGSDGVEGLDGSLCSD
jgi:hypothetical protein